MTSPLHVAPQPDQPPAAGRGEVRTALAAVVDAATGLLGAARVAVLLPGTGGTLRPVARRGYAADTAQALASLLGTDAGAAPLAAGRALAAGAGDPLPPELAAWCEANGEHAFLVVGWSAAAGADGHGRGRVDGALALGFDPPARVTQARIDGARQIAALAAPAIAGARRVAAAAPPAPADAGPAAGGQAAAPSRHATTGRTDAEPLRQAHYAQALRDVLAATWMARDVAAASEAAANILLRELPDVDLVHVWVVDDDQRRLRRYATASRTTLDPRPQDEIAIDDSSGAARAVRQGRTMVWRGDRHTWPGALRDFGLRRGLETVAIVPMQSGRQTFGVLSLGSRGRRDYAPAEQAFLTTLAGQLGGQLEIVRGHTRTEVERRRLQSLIATLPEGLIMVQPDGRVSESNQAASDILGEIHEHGTWAERVKVTAARTPDGRPYPVGDLPLVRALGGETVRAVEMVVRRPDGTDVPLLVSAGPVRGLDGSVSGALCVFQDISRLKELDRLKDDFINTVSHELRTPTTTIRGGALTLLKRGDRLDEETRRQLLQDIAEDSERLHHLVEDLLSLLRSQAGMQMAPEPVRLHRLVNKVILDFGSRVGSKGLTVDVPAGLPVVEADPVALEQVLRNLLENAVKYSPRGGRVEVTADQHDNEVVLSVLDHGAGLQAVDLERVFEPFYRAESSVRSGTGGAGLGLAVCRRLVELQGGRIWAENRPGSGVAFRLTLPVAPDVGD